MLPPRRCYALARPSCQALLLVVGGDEAQDPDDDSAQRGSLRCGELRTAARAADNATMVRLLRVALLACALVPLGAASAQAKTCADYTNQAAAQRGQDTRD